MSAPTPSSVTAATAPRELLLWRHADALPPDDSGNDSERALSARGREEAQRIAEWLAGNAPRALDIDLALCSTARRARETFERLAPHLPARCERRFERALYLGDADRLADEIRGAPESAARVLLVAHNPGIHALALALCSDPALQHSESVSASYPPGALAHLRVQGPSWSRFDARPAQLVAYLRPQELMSRVR